MKVHSLPALKDNYIYVIESKGSNKVIVVDPGDANPVNDFCSKFNFEVAVILLTHHHWDHTDGVNAVKSKFNSTVYAPMEPQKPIFADKFVTSNQKLKIQGLDISIIEVPGHTLGQICYFIESENSVFVGDTLFGCGCGRLFEGSYEQLQSSLKKLRSLPTSTKIYCGHEYTRNNLEFTKTTKLINQRHLDEYELWVNGQLAQSKKTVPLELKREILCNPFLQNLTAEEFKQLRLLRDSW